MIRVAVLVFVSVGAALAAQSPPQVPGHAEPPRSSSVAITGCVSGNTITSVSPDLTDTSNIVTAGRTYRLIGHKDVLRQIRQHHDGHLLEISGTVKQGSEPSAVIRRKKIGKGTIYVGKGQSGTSFTRTVDLPSLQVEGFRLVQLNCPRSNLGR